MVLREDEVRKIKESAVIITPEKALQAIVRGQIIAVDPIDVSNGYRVCMTIEVLRDYLEVHHISVMNPKGRTDPAEAEHIAKEILGEGYKVMGEGILVKNNIHFMKPLMKEAVERR